MGGKNFRIAARVTFDERNNTTTRRHSAVSIKLFKEVYEKNSEAISHAASPGFLFTHEIRESPEKNRGQKFECVEVELTIKL